MPGGKMCSNKRRMRTALCLTLACAFLDGQTRAKPQFEVASVKPAAGRIQAPGPGGPGSSDPGQIAYTNYLLKDLVYRAYEVPPHQLSAPSWMDDGERFDIVAKVPPGATKTDVPLMLQNLLEERFHLKVHHESREAPAYALTVGKNGSKTQEYAVPLPADIVEAARITGYDKDGVPIVRPGYSTGMMGSANGQTFIAIARQPIGSLCQFLSKILQTPVVDLTGLTGRYDVRLHFAVEQIAPLATSAPSGETGLSPAAPQASDPAPTLVEAVQNQLGLKLEAKRLPVDFLVVEHAERRPTEN